MAKQVNAAGIALVTPAGEALFLLRSPQEKNYAGHWSLPGGGIDEGETPEVAVIRELREETGWIAPEDLAPPEKVSVGDNGFITFRQRVNSQFIPTLNAEHVGYAWAPLDKPPTPAHPGVLATLPRIAADAVPGMATSPSAGLPIALTSRIDGEDELVHVLPFEHTREEDGFVEVAGDDGEWKEGDHPRGEGGQFGSGSGGAAAGPTWKSRGQVAAEKAAAKAAKAGSQPAPKAAPGPVKAAPAPAISKPAPAPQQPAPAASAAAGGIANQIGTSLQKVAPFLAHVRVDPSDDGSFYLMASNQKSKFNVPTTVPGDKSATGIAVGVDPGKKRVNFSEVNSHVKGAGRAMVNAIIKATPGYTYSVNDWSGTEFWNKVKAANPGKFAGDSVTEDLLVAADDFGFKEADHPRDDSGKFGSGGGGSGKQTLKMPQFGLTPTPKHDSPKAPRTPMPKSSGAPADKGSTVVFSASAKQPKGIGGKPIESWEPPADWADVDGQAEIDEPELPDLPEGKELSSGVIMREPDGRVWLMRPSGGYGGYDQTFPKGRVDEGLSPQANAIKEAYEETGLKARITGFAGDHEGDTTVTRYYLAERDGGTPADRGEESEAVILTPPDKLHDFLNKHRDQKIAHEHLGAPAPKAKAPWKASPKMFDFEDDLIVGDAGEFKEADHPRDDSGKFGSGGGGSSGGAVKSSGAAAPTSSEKAEAAKSPFVTRGMNMPSVVYRGASFGNEEQSTMSEGKGVYVSADPATSEQWGNVKAYKVKKQPNLLDLSNYNSRARDFVAAVLGMSPKKLTKDQFDEEAPTIFIQNDGVDRMKQMGFAGYRLEGDVFLSGKLSDYVEGVGKPAKPEAKATAKEKSAAKPLKMSDLKKVGKQMGSNPGGVYEGPGGAKFYVKQGKSKAHVTNELVAGELARLAGMKTFDYVPVEGGGHIATKLDKLDKTHATKLSPEELKAAQADFAANAWLSNWDAAGLEYDNLGAKGGAPVWQDLGGALEYRAQGAPKGDKFGTQVGEWSTMRDPGMNPQNAKVFGSMTPEQLKASAAKVAAIPDAEVRAAVAKQGGSKQLAEKMIARKKDLAKKAGVGASDAAPPSWAEFEIDLADEAEGHPSPALDASDAPPLLALDLEGVEVDRTHDGPWMSCMARDGERMYVHESLPETVAIGKKGKVVVVDEALMHHEVPELRMMRLLLQAFVAEHGREPTPEERIKLYGRAHKEAGTPGEEAYLKANGIDVPAWMAWCRGEEARIEKLAPKNPPPDADVRPVPHHHGDLEVTLDFAGAADEALVILTTDGRVIALDKTGEFHEADHPRDADGKFGSGGGSGGESDAAPAKTKTATHQTTKVVDGKRVTASGAALPKHIEALKIPPAWTDVTFDADPKASLLATGKDSKGRRQAVYSAEFSAKQAAAKFARIEELSRKFDAISAQNEQARKSADPRKRAAADCAKLIMTTGIRPGSEDDTGAEKRAYGATTLEGRHVVVGDDGAVRLKFVGKKGVDLDIPVTDEGTAAMLRERKAKAGDDGQLFEVSEKGLLDHVHTLDGGGFKTKDFRTHLGTATAMSEVGKRPAPPAGNEKAYKKAVLEVAKIVSTKLGNTPTIALQAYINPVVFAAWRIAA